MIKFNDKYFLKFNFTKDRVRKNLENAFKDLDIAQRDEIPEVKFNYAYQAIIKAAIALLSHHQIRVKSVPGHHVKTIEILAEILKDNGIADIGNAMRAKRNLDFYSGGVEITEKECREYILFVEKVLAKVKTAMKSA